MSQVAVLNNLLKSTLEPALFDMSGELIAIHYISGFSEWITWEEWESDLCHRVVPIAHTEIKGAADLEAKAERITFSEGRLTFAFAVPWRNR